MKGKAPCIIWAPNGEEKPLPLRSGAWFKRQSRGYRLWLRIGSTIGAKLEDRQTATTLGADPMSLLLHILAKVIVFSVLGVVVLTLLTWFTKSTRSNQSPPPESGEWP